MHFGEARISRSRLPLETLYAYPPHADDCSNANEIVAHHAAGNYLTAGSRLTSLYIHIPFCLHFCHFCGFVKAKYDAHAVEKYTAALQRELSILAEMLSEKCVIDAIYFGGGTASTLSISEVEKILSTINSCFRTSDKIELSFEGECLTLARPGYVEDIKSIGFNRLSFGVQVAHPGLRRGLNLRPTLKSLKSLAARCTPIFDDVCIDYIFGWPGFSLEEQRNDIKTVINELEVPTIELFRFEPLDASPSFMHAIANRVSLDFGYDAYAASSKVCTDQMYLNGYTRNSYTIFSKAARPWQGIKYYDSYYGWQQRQLIGVGIGAQSFFDGLMWGNSSDLNQYIDRTSKGTLSCDVARLYSAAEKELITWPRRGWIARSFVEGSGTPIYLKKINDLVAAGIITKDANYLSLKTDDAWAQVPSLMQDLLSENDRNIYEALSRNRAIERNIANLL